MCCANKKHTLIECIFSAVFLYVFHHFLFTEIYRFLPQFEDFNESGVVYPSYCAQHLLIDIGPKIAATFTVEIRKSMGAYTGTIPSYQLTVFRALFPYSLAQVFSVLEELPRGGRPIYRNEFDLMTVPISSYSD